MSTLLLRFAAPLQAWGTNSKYDIRKTDREPSKSGVVGFLAAALGRKRNDPLDDLNQLRLGVRVDQEGSILQDFHMVHAEKSSYVTRRYYLSDAVFVVGLESQDEEFLNQLEYAVRHPAYPLFLGRRSCPPCGKIVLGVRSKLDLEEALREESWQASEWKMRKERAAEVHLRLVLESSDGRVVRQDYPVSFNPKKRLYEYRGIREEDCIFLTGIAETEHDPMIGM